MASNLVQNPSFEAGLAGWTSGNVIPADVYPFEGTATARMGPGVASLWQDVPIVGLFKASFIFRLGSSQQIRPLARTGRQYSLHRQCQHSLQQDAWEGRAWSSFARKEAQ
jgi:hypothetical protein